MEHQNEIPGSRSRHLFDMELQYSNEAPECAPVGIKEGRIIGSGNGTVKGQEISGALSWSNYENTIREGLGKLQIPGKIRTDDGAEILFEALGMAMTPNSSQPSKWVAGGVLHFETENDKYRWLNSALAIYEGEFGMETAHASYRVYIAA